MEFLTAQIYRPFLDQIFKGLDQLKIDVSGYDMDHICYRVGSRERYDFIKHELRKHNRLLGENMINGRPIANFILSTPLTYKNRRIEILEIPAPKPFSTYEEGYEHVEFVIEGALEDLLSQWSEVEFDLTGMEKTINRDVRIRMDKLSVKFHEQSLREVIAAEKSES